jgi:hypothetical protein
MDTLIKDSRGGRADTAIAWKPINFRDAARAALQTQFFPGAFPAKSFYKPNISQSEILLSELGR